jgi:sulfatase modifying factor 1
MSRSIILAGLLCCFVQRTPADADIPAPGAMFRDCDDACPEMVVVPAGSFVMGSAREEEHPAHRVTMASAFAVGRFEVTRDEYAAFVRETKLADPAGCNVHEPPRWPTARGLSWHDTGFPQTGRHPVVCVSWREAVAYTKWLSRKTGHAYRLLSESEWEYAARAGTTTQAYWGDDAAQACAYANGVDRSLADRFPIQAGKRDDIVPCTDGYVFTAPAGTFRPNAFGLHDMLGNAFEWVADCSNDNYAGAPADGSARADGDCSMRMNRGGSWTSIPTGLRSAHRGNDDAEATRVVDLGFRVARGL